MADDDAMRELRDLWRRAQAQTQARWTRTLPFGDYVVDRWEKASTLGFGAKASIYDSALVIGDVKVGEGTWVGPFTVLDGSGGLTIGAWCSIAAGVQIYSHDTVAWTLSGGKQPPERSPTVIGDRCYIGPNSVIAKGVTIGEGCVIGANSVVLDDLAPGTRAAGAPARALGPAPSVNQGG